MSNVGDYVTVPSIVGTMAIGDPYAPYALVEQRFKLSLEKAEEMLDLLVGADGDSGYLGDMSAAIASAPTIAIDVPAVDTTIGLKESGLTAPTFDMGTLQTVQDESYSVTLTSTGLDVPEFSSTLKAFPPDATYAEPVISALPGITTNDLTDTTLPAEVNASMVWSASLIPTTLYDAILVRMLTDLQQGATGLDPIVEQAIWDRARNRQQTARDVAYQKLNNDIAGRGFTLPPGALLSALTDFAAEGIRQDTEINNSIITTQGDLAQKNSQFMMQQAVALETLIRNTINEKDKTALEYVKSQATLLVQEYAERIRAYVAGWEGKKTRVQAQVEALKGVIEGNKGAIEIFKEQWNSLKIRVEAAASENKSIVDVYNAEVQGFAEAEKAVAARNNSAAEIFKTQYDAFKTKADVVTSSNKGLIDVFNGRVQGYSETEKAIAMQNSSAIEVIKAKVAAADLEVRAAIATAEQEVAGYNAEMSLKERVTGDMAKIAAQTVASMMAAVNASASMGYSGNESSSKSVSNQASLSESHSYEHDPLA